MAQHCSLVLPHGTESHSEKRGKELDAQRAWELYKRAAGIAHPFGVETVRMKQGHGHTGI